jgi:hypothetical protein
MALGGDIEEITFNHPTIGSGTIFPKSGEDSTIELGGFRSNDDANGIDGGGNMIDQMNRVRPFFETTVAWDMNVAGTQEKITELAGDPVPAEWTVSHVSGVVYGITGKPVGDVQGNMNNATIKLKVAGGGKMKKIVG